VGIQLKWAFALCLAVCAAQIGTADDRPLYKNPTAPVSARVEDLLGRMTLEEKVVQLTAVWQGKVAIFDDKLQFDPAKAAKAYPDGIGQLTRPGDRRGDGSPRVTPWRDVGETIALTNAVQHWSVEKTRLGIPVLFHEEGLHGYAGVSTTMFPQAIALASSWDTELVRQVDAVVAREIRARGVSLVLSPVVDVARDPRWGRIEETFGEDPYLVGELGVAAVLGLQGGTLPLADGKVFATLKHMTGHGQPESGTNVGPAVIAPRALREVFLPPFEQAVKRTNIHSIMASYNEIDGIPSHANTWLLQDLLRGEWGYKGAVVSDYDGIDQLATLHHVEPDFKSAGIRALKAGVDMDLPDGASFRYLPEALKEGKVSKEQIDHAVGHVLELKFLAGLFEHPYADAAAAEALTGNADARAVALTAARRAPILLKNDGALPFDTAQIKTLAVIGPNAGVVRLGGYSGFPRQTVSVLDGLKTKLAGKVKLVSAEGVKITLDDDWWADEVKLADPAENARLIKEAVKVAQVADHILLVLGDTEQTSREGWSDTHLGDRSSLDLVGQQYDLARAIFALKKPTVVLLLNGRPPSVVEISEKADALIEGWYLGQEGGTAVADLLFGDANPSGKLPVTIPRSVGQLPMFYDKKPSARRGYLFDTTDSLYPFGWGLSYTKFELGAPVLSTASIKLDGETKVSVEVKNSGKRAGDEVVQLYIHQLVSSATRPIKELRGFQRVSLEPGQVRTVTFTINAQSLRYWNAEMKRVVEPGDFEIMTGDNSVDLKNVILTVKSDPTPSLRGGS
jgi:beta-glucosidase